MDRDKLLKLVCIVGYAVVAAVETTSAITARDTWEENKHPRADNGQFGHGGGGKKESHGGNGAASQSSSGEASGGTAAKVVGENPPRANTGRGDPDEARLRISQALRGLGYKARTQSQKFHSDITQAKTGNPFGACVDLHTPEEYQQMNCIAFDDGSAGLAIKPDGDIVSVYKRPGSKVDGFVKHALTAAILNGGKKCDCYSIKGALPAMYAQCGMVPACKIKFNDEFAPDDWNYERDGRPDIVFMSYCGDAVESMVAKYGTYKPFKTYTDDEVPYIEDKDGVDAYTLAQKYRDGGAA